MKKVLITGPTGATGGNAIKKLLELKVPVRALVPCKASLSASTPWRSHCSNSANNDARILDLQIGEPVMLVHGVTYLDDGRAIEVEESHFRAESVEFIIELGEHSQYARLMPHDLLRRRISSAMKAVGSTAGH